MKILISRLSFGQIGGAELSARDIARALQHLGHKPLLLTNLKDPIVTKDIENYKHSPTPLKASGIFSSLFYILRLLAQLVFYYRIIVRFNPDIIHPHSRHDQLLLTVIGKMLKKPVIWRDPGDLVPQLSTELRNPFHKLNRRLQLWSLRNATHVIMLNEEEYNIVHKLTGLERKKVSVIGSDIMFEDYSSPKNINKKRDKAITTYGVISRLDKHKGVQYAIQAFNKLALPHTRLIIAGDGEYGSELKKMAKTNPDISFLGKVDNPSDFYAQIDTLIQPSEFEGWGRTVKEAMLFGIPVIGSNTGGIAEQIRHRENGLLFTVGNVDELIDMMGRVRKSTTAKKLVAGGKKTIQQNGDWLTKVEGQYIPLFERCKKNG